MKQEPVDMSDNELKLSKKTLDKPLVLLKIAYIKKKQLVSYQDISLIMSYFKEMLS